MNPKDCIDRSWFPIFGELYKEPLTTLSTKILPNISYQPKPENIFRAFSLPVNEVKVVILGQDPYPTPGDAVGLAFVNGRGKIPVSLKIIYNEIDDTVIYSPNQKTGEDSGIETWSKQGVLLLNTALTVETGKAGSHIKYWESFTQSVIKFLSSTNPCIWMLWGAKAQAYTPFITTKFSVDGYNRETIEDIPISDNYNYILTAPHPAAEVYQGGKAGFYGCDHFYMVNRVLNKKRLKEIIW